MECDVGSWSSVAECTEVCVHDVSDPEDTVCAQEYTALYACIGTLSGCEEYEAHLTGEPADAYPCLEKVEVIDACEQEAGLPEVPGGETKRVAMEVDR